MKYKVMNKHRLDGDWRIFGEQESVTGIHHRKDDAKKYCQRAMKCDKKKLPFGIELIREPDNTYDPNAIMVVGWWTKKKLFSKKLITDYLLIGYVQRDKSQEISEKAEENTPISGELNSIYIGKDDFLDINFVVLLPGIKSGYWDGKKHPF